MWLLAQPHGTAVFVNVFSRCGSQSLVVYTPAARRVLVVSSTERAGTLLLNVTVVDGEPTGTAEQPHGLLQEVLAAFICPCTTPACARCCWGLSRLVPLWRHVFRVHRRVQINGFLDV